MSRLFSSSELFNLRNHIPIEEFIQKYLNIPSKNRNGYFRFQCPICKDFHTAVNPKTNLARCFKCERNFNTIDLMMICQALSFVDSVNQLKKILQKYKRNPL